MRRAERPARRRICKRRRDGKAFSRLYRSAATRRSFLLLVNDQRRAVTSDRTAKVRTGANLNFSLAPDRLENKPFRITSSPAKPCWPEKMLPWRQVTNSDLRRPRAACPPAWWPLSKLDGGRGYLGYSTYSQPDYLRPSIRSALLRAGL